MMSVKNNPDSAKTANKIIDGRKIARDLQQKITDYTEHLASENKPQPVLAIIIVGNDPASEIYVRNKIRTANQCGIGNREFFLPAETQGEEILSLIETLNNDPEINGILLQLPLPSHIDEKKLLNKIAPKKDVDGFHVVNTGRLYHNYNCFIPCTAIACLLLVRSVMDRLKGVNAVVVGRSNIVGKPVAELLGQSGCTVTVVHRDTRNIEQITSTADLMVVATGNPHLIGANHVKENAVIIDVGINRMPDGQIVGDVDFNAVIEKVSHITPVPRGVGPMTIACLLLNTIKAHALQNNITIPDFCF